MLQSGMFEKGLYMTSKNSGIIPLEKIPLFCFICCVCVEPTENRIGRNETPMQNVAI